MAMKRMSINYSYSDKKVSSKVTNSDEVLKGDAKFG